MHLILRGAILLAVVWGGGLHPDLGAQDVELLGRLHGTQPPRGYYEMMARDPGAFQFERALFRRGLRMRELPEVRAPGQSVTTTFEQAFSQLLVQDARPAPVAGTFRFPLILGLFSDSPDPAPLVSREMVQREYWDGPQSNPRAAGTIPQYYAEISMGRADLSGTTFDWRRTSLTRTQVTDGVSGISYSHPYKPRTGEFIVQILQALDDGSIDWGLFDNDGPDGIPNSGDDDGYVDILTIMHPTPGGECNDPDRPNRIWSHKWNLRSIASREGGDWAASIVLNQGYVTKTPSANPNVDFIRINDYTIQPVLDCGGRNLNTIGVFAHELGHGFGLPDLYATNAQHAGIGNWGLMGTGSWGCNSITPQMPCHMSAWSKEFLGWAEVLTLQPGTYLGTLTLPPVQTSGKIFRMDSGDGSLEYILVENRQPIGFDQFLYAPGLLVWHVDPVTIAQRRFTNSINTNPNRMGVWLRQADGMNRLAVSGGGRGDSGDPFPGATGNTVFHAGSNPSSWTHGGKAMGLTLLDIQHLGTAMRFEVYTRYQTVTLRTEGATPGTGLISVDGGSPGPQEWSFESAPFTTYVLEAAHRELIGPGVSIPFQGWSDGGARVRPLTTHLAAAATYTATYGGREYRLTMSQTSPAPGLTPGQVTVSTGDGSDWIPEGGDVVITAFPNAGFRFRQWTGDLAGKTNPAIVAVSEPLQAGAVFDIPFEMLTSPFLLTAAPELPPDLRNYLDTEGNQNGVYDLGDFRAFVVRNPDLEPSGEASFTVEVLITLVGGPSLDPSSGGAELSEPDHLVLGGLHPPYGGTKPEGEPRREDTP